MNLYYVTDIGDAIPTTTLVEAYAPMEAAEAYASANEAYDSVFEVDAPSGNTYTYRVIDGVATRVSQSH